MFSTSMGCPGGSALNKPPPIREVAAPRAHSAKLFSAPRQLIPLMIAGRAVTKRAGILRQTPPSHEEKSLVTIERFLACAESTVLISDNLMK